jgi:RNA polymerase sigma-70 factor (ECF subfamily)
VQNKDDRAAFDEVFLPHMAEAYRLAQWLTGNAYDAEDVVQDAALRAFRGIRASVPSMRAHGR